MRISLILPGMIICSGLLFSMRQHRGLPRPAHVIVVIEENHGFSEVVGSATAPYITQLAREGAIFTDAHGVTHPSQPNYLAIFSGSTQGIKGDECLQQETPFTTPNLAAALIQKGFKFTGFAQSMPQQGFLGCQDQKGQLTGETVYARKHTPWINWQGNGKNDIPTSCSQPMTSFPKDFNQLPTIAFVIPDQDHDMHNIGKPGDSAAISRGDIWMKENLDSYVKWARSHNSLLILTFDEDDFTRENHVPTLFVGPMVRAGKYAERINHCNVLHTLEAMYGLTREDTSKAVVIKDIWKN